MLSTLLNCFPFQLPLFRINVIIEPESLTLNPDYDITEHIFMQVWELWEKNTRDIKSFIGDKLYISFTK